MQFMFLAVRNIFGKFYQVGSCENQFQPVVFTFSAESGCIESLQSFGRSKLKRIYFITVLEVLTENFSKTGIIGLQLTFLPELFSPEAFEFPECINMGRL